MGKFDSAINFIHKVMSHVRNDVNNTVSFCAALDDRRSSPTPQAPAQASGSTQVGMPEAARAAPTKPPQPDKEPAEPSCPNGECCQYETRLYYTCDKSVTCPRGLKKQHYDSLKRVDNYQIFAFMKRYARPDEENYYQNNIDVRCEYVSAFFPHLAPLRNFIITILEVNESFDPEESPFIQFLFELNEKNVSYPDLAVYVEKLYKVYDDHRYDERGKVIEKMLATPSVLLRDPSLFARDKEDFEYSYGALELFSDKTALAKYLKDVSLVSIDMLFDENGKLKPAGIGGPEIGESADGIWSLLEDIGDSDNAKNEET